MKVVVQRISLPCDSFSQRRAAIILEVEVNVFACSATISACSKTSNWQQAVMLLEMVCNLQVQLTPGPHSSNWMSKCLAFLESWSSQGLQISTSREIEGGPPPPVISVCSGTWWRTTRPSRPSRTSVSSKFNRNFRTLK